jgi:hypothetical protein
MLALLPSRELYFSNAAHPPWQWAGMENFISSSTTTLPSQRVREFLSADCESLDVKEEPDRLPSAAAAAGPCLSCGHKPVLNDRMPNKDKTRRAKTSAGKPPRVPSQHQQRAVHDDAWCFGPAAGELMMVSVGFPSLSQGLKM